MSDDNPRADLRRLERALTELDTIDSPLTPTLLPVLLSVCRRPGGSPAMLALVHFRDLIIKNPPERDPEAARRLLEATAV